MKVKKIITNGVNQAIRFDALTEKLYPYVDTKEIGKTEVFKHFMSSVAAIGSRQTRNKYLVYGFAAGVITTSAVVIVRKVKKAKKCGL